MTVFASIEDLRVESARRVPKAFQDYVENGAYTEATLDANRRDLSAILLRQHLTGGPATRDASGLFFGKPATIPVALAPTGLCGAIHARGELLAARAAKAFGVPYCLSTMAIASIEDVAKEVGGDFWFQLYPMKEQRINASLLDRAKAAGCPVLMLTIDAQVEGTRYADERNGLGVPPRLTAGNIWGILSHPRWAFGQLHSTHYTFGNLIGELDAKGGLGGLAEVVKQQFQPVIDAKLLDWVRARWDGKLIVKGILDEADAEAVIKAGADAIVVSNHGGRQLEGAQSTAAAFPRIRDAVAGRAELYADSGVRTGIDILRFLAMGAQGVFIGRAFMYGLGANGEAGVTRALEILKDELDRTMNQCGLADLSDLEQVIVPPSATSAADGSPAVHAA